MSYNINLQKNNSFFEFNDETNNNPNMNMNMNNNNPNNPNNNNPNNFNPNNFNPSFNPSFNPYINNFNPNFNPNMNINNFNPSMNMNNHNPYMNNFNPNFNPNMNMNNFNHNFSPNMNNVNHNFSPNSNPNMNMNNFNHNFSPNSNPNMNMNMNNFIPNSNSNFSPNSNPNMNMNNFNPLQNQHQNPESMDIINNIDNINNISNITQYSKKNVNNKNYKNIDIDAMNMDIDIDTNIDTDIIDIDIDKDKPTTCITSSKNNKQKNQLNKKELEPAIDKILINTAVASSNTAASATSTATASATANTNTANTANSTNTLCNMFDNTLTTVMIVTTPNTNIKNKKNIKQSTKNTYIVYSIDPVCIDNANFNNISHPNERYVNTMCRNVNNNINDTELHESEIYEASEINTYSLDTHRQRYNHNIKLNGNGNENNNIIADTFIYARCSRDNDCSITTQLDSCLKYALVHNLKLLPFGIQYDNNVCARQMQNLKHELGFWTQYIPDNSNLILYSVDRLSRNLLLGIQYLDKLLLRNIKIHFVTNEVIYSKTMTATSKSLVQQELVSSEKYSNITSEKIKHSMKRLRDAGNYIGNVSYGYKIININGIRTLTQHSAQQQIIKIIINKYNISFAVNKTCSTSILNVIKYCNSAGIYNKKNTSFTQSQIETILKNNLYKM